MISRFFIDRPIFATVLSIVITLAGGIAVFSLPIAQYPQITPPTIQVMCTYPGASAEVVAQSVAAPIEQQVNGVEDMMYMSSACANDGSYSLSVTFKPGINLNFAQVLVQNRVNLALPQMPDVVRATGVTTRKRSPDILLLVSVYSPDDSVDQLYLSNFATVQLKDELARIDGVGDVFMFGQQDYSMRVWLDPDRLASLNLNAGDVVTALRAQNSQVATGQIGQQPVNGGQQFQVTLSTLGRLTEPKQFEDVIIKQVNGRIVRIKDVGHVVLGAKAEDITSKLDGKSCTNLAVFQMPDSNALATADRVRAKMNELKDVFPAGVDYDICFDTTPFIRESVNEVVRTLILAVILVAIVVLVFLQNWRSAIIPLVAVPVAIVGTFAVMAAIGFSLNNLTLFGLVLAIGIVVDDAIVVVEAVEHHIEHGLAPRQAALKAMSEVSGPVIAVALVLSAVFLPCAFISGITGQFFRQFALTIAVSTVLSAFNSLTLSPALAAILLKPTTAKKDWFGRALDFTLGWFFRLFNFTFRHATNMYTRVVGLALRGSLVVLVLYVGLLGLTKWGFTQLPVGYIPAQDKGYLLCPVELPEASSVERTRDVMARVDKIVRGTKGVKHTITVAGQSFSLGVNASNYGNFFVMLDDFDKRTDPSLKSDVIAKQLYARFSSEIPDAKVLVFGPPAVNGLGNAGGYKLVIEDRGDLGLAILKEQTDKFLTRANQPDTNLNQVITAFKISTPQYFVNANRDHIYSTGVNLSDVYGTYQTYLGSIYVNDFNRFGRTWQVTAQAEAPFRKSIETVNRLRVRNQAGNMVPLGSVVDIHETTGPLVVTRYNMYPATIMQGDVKPGFSSGDAIDIVDKLANEQLPKNMAYEWTEITYIQTIAANTGAIIFSLAVLLVFLVLAAQYESWSLPLAVILVVPMCLLSSIAGVAIASSNLVGITTKDINVFTQIGFVVLVGLASKNAVLIVEFAKHKYENGMTLREATLEACRLRLRPILMTSFAFILGVVPLLISTGAGAEMRRTLGAAVFGGMLGVTLFGIFLTPVFFYVIEGLGSTRLFASPVMQRISAVALGIFGLGYLRAGLRIAIAETKRALAKSARRKPMGDPDAPPLEVTILTNGNGDGGLHSLGTHGKPYRNGHPLESSGPTFVLPESGRFPKLSPPEPPSEIKPET